MRGVRGDGESCCRGAGPGPNPSGAAGFVEGRGSGRLCWREAVQADGGSATAFPVLLLGTGVGLRARGRGRAWGNRG